MLGQGAKMALRIQQVPHILKHYNFIRRFLSSDVPKPTTLGQPSSRTSQTPQEYVELSNARKRMFVFAGIYKNMKEVPDKASKLTLSRNMDKFRVRFSLLIMFVCALGSMCSIFLSKDVVKDLEEENAKNQ